MIVGTAGTTAGGLIDPLDSTADLAAERRVWFHADAAWGGAAVLVPRLQPALKGIERADSITWDAHKWLSVPMGAGLFFCRHADAVQQAFALTTTSYMPRSAADTFDSNRFMCGAACGFQTSYSAGANAYYARALQATERPKRPDVSDRRDRARPRHRGTCAIVSGVMLWRAVKLPVVERGGLQVARP